MVARDATADLAVLHVDAHGLPAATLGDSAALHVGDPVVAIGNALALGGGPTVTEGIVSALDRTISTENGERLTHAIQTDAAINRQFDLGTDTGALVVGVTPGGPAENAGVQEGDVITDLNGHAVATSDDLGAAVDGLHPGDHVDVRIVRGGDGQTLSLTIGQRPGSASG